MVRSDAAIQWPKKRVKNSRVLVNAAFVACTLLLLVVSLVIVSSSNNQGDKVVTPVAARPSVRSRPASRSPSHSATVVVRSRQRSEVPTKIRPIEDAPDDMTPISGARPVNIVEAGVMPQPPIAPLAPRAADPAAPASKLVHEFSGVGKEEHLNTKLFKVNDDWGFDWEVRGDILNIVLVDPAGAPLQGADALMNEFRDPAGKNKRVNTFRETWWINPDHGAFVGPQSGHINYHRGGTYALSVWAVGPWRIKVYQYPNRL
jgi:hypothetical protein